MNKPRFSVRSMALAAILAAMCTVLGGLSVKIGGNFEFSFESLPVHMGALLFGPVEGALIGGLGTFIYQVLLSGYGVTVTTALWILPYVACGLIVGALSRRWTAPHRGFKLTLILLAAELAITLLNTLALYVDSLVNGYYTPALVFGTLAVRLCISAARAAAYAAALPILTRRLGAAAGR